MKINQADFQVWKLLQLTISQNKTVSDIWPGACVSKA